MTILGDSFFTQVHSICQPTNDFSDEDLTQCCQLDTLELCYLGGCAITDAGLENIGNLTHLVDLKLSDTPITDAALKRLERLHELKMLDLTGTGTSEAGVHELQAKLPGCKIFW